MTEGHRRPDVWRWSSLTWRVFSGIAGAHGSSPIPEPSPARRRRIPDFEPDFARVGMHGLMIPSRFGAEPVRRNMPGKWRLAHREARPWLRGHYRLHSL